MCGQCWDQLGLAFSSDTVCLSQYRPEQKLDKQEGFTVQHDTSLISNSGEQIETDLKIESCVFSSGAFSACLVRQISPSSASILSQSRTGGHPAHFQNIVNQSISEDVLRLTVYDDCVGFFLILTETSDTLKRVVVIVNRVQQAGMFLVTEFLHVQVQQGLPLHLRGFLLPWSNSEVEPIETGTVKFTGKRN